MWWILLACKDGANPEHSGPAPDDSAAHSAADSGADSGGHSGDSAAPVDCNTAGGALPEGLEELSWDDGAGVYTVHDFNWTLTAEDLHELPLHEVARFGLDRPARIWGISVQLGSLPAAQADQAVPMALYPDFGHNGFDFWQLAPLWEGSRCLEDLATGEWVTWALPEPVVVDQPTLVYAGHRREGEAGPAILLDAGGDEDCALFDDCHSAMNLPELTSFVSGGYKYTFWNGYSFNVGNDYLIRLHVEWLPAPAPEALLFADHTGSLALSARQSWADIDNDGDEDLLTAGLRLYRNEGGGVFTDTTTAAGLAAVGASGGVFGDYDNDGCLDLFAFVESYWASDVLLQGDCAGGFTDVTAAAGITDVQTYNVCAGDSTRDRAPTPAAAWWDIDSDGLLDLYVANFICWDEYTYYVDQVWHNEGAGVFTEWTGLYGFTDSTYASRGASPADADGDGDVDLLVNTYVLQRDLYYTNLGDGTVDEDARGVGLAGRRDVSGYYGHTIGTAWGDLDGDGDLDVVSANLAHPRFWDFSNKTQVLLQEPAGTWTDACGDGVWDDPWCEVGLVYAETHSVPTLADLNNDGALDLLISEVYEGRPTDFYWGVGDGSFVQDRLHAGVEVENGWGMAAADFDQDGAVDLAASGRLYHNQLGPQGSFLAVRAVGDVASNWAAIGATVRVYGPAGEVFVRHVQGGTGQGGQDSLTLHFGLGALTEVAAVEVDFPGGGTVRYEGPFAVDQKLWLYEHGSATAGWAP